MKKWTALATIALLSSAHILMAQSYQTNNPSPSYSSYPSYPNNQINWLQNYSEAAALSRSSSKPILIVFTGTSWCPACMKLEREVLNRPEFAQAVSQHFIFLKAEFPSYSENSPYKPLIDRYHIEAFPTLVVVNANGQQLYTVEYRDGGPQSYAQELLQKLRQEFSGQPQPW